ncbi:MAG: DUF2851 family protein [Kiritimatiellales bacterium]
MYSAPSIPEHLFFRAAKYKSLFQNNELCETPARRFPYTERHLQALWFDKQLRPPELKTTRGEIVTVENAGRWNLEAGPDFTGAVLLIGRSQRRISGDVEIHVHPSGWKHHGHADDLRYSNVRFHITWFAGAADETLFPADTVHIALAGQCTVDLNSIDTAAYPYLQPNLRGRLPEFGGTPDEIIEILESAGVERLKNKTRHIARQIAEHGEAQALYEEVAGALGYKHNKAPFKQLARRLPVNTLIEKTSGDWEKIYAVLLGVSGLLPKQPAASWTDEAKKELRRLWDKWWREEHRWEDVIPLKKTDWRLAGVRPLNHPVRRLCALAQWVAGGIFKNMIAVPSSHFLQFKNNFWTNHIGWTGREASAELVGESRLNAIELNVIIPFRLAKGDSTALNTLPAEPANSIIRETAYTLFGPDHSPKLYRTALARQGLIQIFNDYILNQYAG